MNLALDDLVDCKQAVLSAKIPFIVLYCAFIIYASQRKKLFNFMPEYKNCTSSEKTFGPI